MGNDKRDVKFLLPGLRFSLLSHLATFQQSIVKGVFKPFSASFDDVIQSPSKVRNDSVKCFGRNSLTFLSDVVFQFFDCSRFVLVYPFFQISPQKIVRGAEVWRVWWPGVCITKYTSRIKVLSRVLKRFFRFITVGISKFEPSSWRQLKKKWRKSNFYVFYRVLKNLRSFWDTLYMKIFLSIVIFT